MTMTLLMIGLMKILQRAMNNFSPYDAIQANTAQGD